ncbi:hypothetical protein HN695_02930 [Candidatus Woesearchaeota archaeon]|nr:hypothetical protein [Candidatus Woesearchaeota archaeon]MBT5272145.1 hypothetical protein [Candidatus Woesearchaeota archaeon]MBT6040948.1 hypothetical protein [Candidatus Woesearchaeota archaeon]MBT6336282.1 hypothetical protein [Candidatus Woesearchaeota archaeon]MBT7927265.1 hypothetical protein [Candidatus Woesearchaeota archaeon]
MKQITTNDNSITYHNEEYDETYHSTSGAIEEAQKKFVEACEIREFVGKKDNNGKFVHNSISILDVCFGLGYNTAVAIDNILGINPDCKIIVVALENDPTILNEINKLNPKINSFPIIKQLISKLASNNEYEVNLNNIKILLLLDDARETIKTLQNQEIKFNFCFLDPFSPKKCPELWTEEFFKDIFAVMADNSSSPENNSKLATYSCARIVRENLAKAGFTVKDGPIVGRRSPGTIGVKE